MLLTVIIFLAWKYCLIVISDIIILCILYVGHLESIGSELAQNKQNKESPHLELLSDVRGSIANPHQQLLVVLSNIGFCKDELTCELYGKYKHIWSRSR